MAPEVAQASCVLDSWPILEWIKVREPASRRFQDLLWLARSGSLKLEMCRLNLGEARYIIRKAPDVSNRERALAALVAIPLVLHSVDDLLVDEAVELKSQYRISYADCFAAALAIRLGVPLVTGDREFRALEANGLLRLEWLGA